MLLLPNRWEENVFAPQWSDTSIKIVVPDLKYPLSYYGDAKLFVTRSGGQVGSESNPANFRVNPLIVETSNS